MRVRLIRTLACAILIGLAVAACTTTAPLPEPDRVATRVAEELAVAATLTAAAPPLTATQPRPASTPEPTSPPLPSSSPTREIDRVIPGAGTDKGLQGVIALPDYDGLLEEPIVFGDKIVFHLQVYDPGTGSQENGAGIQTVDIFIFDPDGQTVQQRTERNPKYCAFSGGDNGEPCNVWAFSEYGNTWPNGQAVVNNVCCYEVNMIVHTLDPNKDEANWRFTFIVGQP